MDAIHKLEPKIEAFIFEKKKSEPETSCRKLAALVEKKFKLKISKSTVNSVMKKTGLSMPVGRRCKRKKAAHDANAGGAIFLKAIDCLTGGTHAIAGVVKDKLQHPGPELQAQIESLLYLPLFEGSEQAPTSPDFGLWQLVEHNFGPEGLNSYLNELQGVADLNSQIWKVIPDSLQEVRCIKADVGDLSVYLDSQLHTLWSTPNMPHDFSTTLYSANSCIKEIFQQNKPLVLFMAPGYEKPRKEFFELFASLEGTGKELTKFTLLGNKLEELGVVRMPEPKKKRAFIFGLWPWQFNPYRQVKSTGEFRAFTSETTGEEFYIAEVEVEITQPNVKQSITLKGCALKGRVWEKIRLIILSNLADKGATPDAIANLYLNRWPNMEETFQDFSKKIELFTYTASTRRFFSTEKLDLDKPAPESVSAVLAKYLETLDMYLRWHFLPVGYENKDFPAIKERFYSLKARLKKEKNHILAIFKPASGYPFMDDLEYLCRRMNEREIILSHGRRLLATIA